MKLSILARLVSCAALVATQVAIPAAARAQDPAPRPPLQQTNGQLPTQPSPAVPATGGVPTPANVPTAQNPADIESAIYSPEPEADFGELLQGEIKPHTFKVGNRGTENIKIQKVQPTCGCTVAQVKTSDGRLLDPKLQKPGEDLLELKPGEFCEINVEFNSAGQPTTQLEKHVMVISSDNRMPNLNLTMKISVIQGVQLEPNPLQFGDITRGEQKSLKAYARLVKVKDLEIKGVQEKPDYVDVKWERGKTQDGADAIVIDVTLLPTAPIGYVAPTIAFATSDPRLSSLRMQVYANVKSEVTFSTGNAVNGERIDFEVIDFGQSVTRTVVVKNANEQRPYRVTGVEIDSTHKDKIEAKLETVKEGAEYKITLTTAPDLDARFFRGILRIQSDSPEMPMKELHFHGWVKKS